MSARLLPTPKVVRGSIASRVSTRELLRACEGSCGYRRNLSFAIRMCGLLALPGQVQPEFQHWACSLVNAQPFGGRKKGADGGVDGLIYFQDADDVANKVVGQSREVEQPPFRPDHSCIAKD